MKTKFEQEYQRLLEMVTADVGIGAVGTEPGKLQGDFYAPGDARVPHVTATKKKLFGKKKKGPKPLMLKRNQGSLW